MGKCTQADIAKALGISQATVGLVVGNSRSPLRARLSDETVRKIEAKAKELGYMPHRAAQALRTGRSNLILLLNFGGYSEIGGRRAYQVGRLVHQAGFDFQTIDAYWWIGDIRHIVNQILALRPLGIIVTGSLQTSLPTEELIAAGIHMVAMGVNLPGVPWVRYNAKAAIREITSAAIDSGRRRLALMTRGLDYGTNWQLQERQRGFLEAVQAAGGAVEAYSEGETDFGFSRKKRGVEGSIVSTILRSLPFQNFEPAMEAAERILNASIRPDILICSNDRFAIGAATICSRRNVQVPGEIAISGFDNISFTTQGAVPLTTVEQPIEEMCAASVEALRARIDKPATLEASPEEQVFPCQIIWRDSFRPEPQLQTT